jgi:lipid-binding SYLF domain-containing protein
MLCLALVGCASGPKGVSDQQKLETQARNTLREMTSKDPSLHRVLSNSVAYAVFPNVGKGGFIVGGGYGDGILFVNGHARGVVSIKQASVGAQVGGESFSELIVIRDLNQVRSLESGNWNLGAHADAVALTAGAGASANVTRPVSVFVMPKGGLMVDISVAGQRIDFQPLA